MLTWSVVLTTIIGAMGAVASALIRERPVGVPRPASDNIFFVLYGRMELQYCLALVLFAVAAWLYVRSGAHARSEAGAPPPRAPSSRFALVAAIVVCAVAWVGSHLVLHDLPFSMDEYGAVFQSKIIAAGHFAVRLPQEWRRFGQALVPVWVTYRPEQGVWLSSYLPGYATIRALFVTIGAPSFTNPVLAGLTVLTLAGVCRRLWPTSPWRMWLAIAFLVTSSQFLITSMSWYSMPAHLLLNLFWLYLYLRNDRASLLALPWVGVFALGLHNPFPHALFVAPFLLRMLRERRYARLAYLGVVYAAGAAVWYAWLRFSIISAQGQAQGQGFLSVFKLPGLKGLELQALNLTLLFSWQSPLVGILLIAAFLAWRQIGNVGRDLALGLVLSFMFYFVFPFNQGHGWGYRYIYNVLGNIVLLAVMGGVLVAETVDRTRAMRAVAASAALSLLVLVPLRATEVSRFVRPFAAAMAYTSTYNASAVIIYPDSSFFGRDLVRNDPFLATSPKLFTAYDLSPADLQELHARFGDRVHFVHPAELARLGTPTWNAPAAGRRPGR